MLKGMKTRNMPETAMTNPIRILLVDNSPHFLEAARDFLQYQESLTVVGTATDGGEALAQSQSLQPDIILLDLNLTNGSGLKLIPIFKANLPGARVIVLTMMEESSYRAAALQAGADGFVHKSNMSKELTSTILETMEHARVDTATMGDGSAAARQEEARFLRLAEHLPDLIYRYEFKPKRGFTYVSPSAAAMTGYTPQEHYDDPDMGSKIVHPQDRHLLKSATQGGTDPAHPTVLRWVRRDGRILWIEQRNVPVFNESGELTTIEGIARDITAQKQAEEESLNFQKRYLALFEQDHEAVFIIDLEGRYLDANERSAQMMGYSLDEMKSLSFRNTSAEIEESRRTIQRLLDGEKIPSYERLFRRKSGEVFPVEINVELVRDGAGTPLHIQSVVRDITGQKLIEKALREGEARYRELFESNPHPMWVYDLESLRFLAVNDAAVAQYGYSREEFFNMSLRDIRPSEEVPNLLENIARETSVVQNSSGWRHRLKDGSLIEVEITSHALQFEGRPARLVLANNITERKQAEETLKASERFVRETLDSLTSHIAILDERGEVVAVNRSWREFARANAGDPSLLSEGVNYLAVCDAAQGRDSEEASTVAAGIRAVIRGEQEFCSFEYPCHSPDEKRWFVVRITKFSGEGPLRIVVAHNNITMRRQAEEALRESEENYRQLFQAESDAILLIENETGQILQANNAACVLYGYTQEEILSKKNVELSAEPEQTRNVTRNTPLDAGQVVTIPLRFHRKKDGTVFPVEITGRFFLHQGRSVHIAAIRDISERKQAEEALKTAEERFRTLIEYSSDEISILSIDGELIYESPTVSPTLGYKHGDFQGRNILQLVHPDDIVQVQEHFARLIQYPDKQERDQFRLKHRDGSWRWVEAVGTNLLSEPSVGGIVINYHDVSGRKRAEDQIKRRVTELEALYQSGIAFSQTFDQREIGEKIIEVIAGHLNWHHAAVRIRREESQELELLAYSHPSDGEAGEERIRSAITHTGQGMAGRVIENGQPLRSGDLGADPRYIPTYPGMKSGLYVPIKMFDWTIGCVSVESDILNAFTEEDERLLSTLAVQAAVALENARSYESAVSTAHRLAMLYEAGQQIAHATQDMEALYASVHQAVQRLMPAEAFTIVLHHKEYNELDAVYLFDKGVRWSARRIPFGEGFSSQVISSGDTIMVHDLEKTPLIATHFGTDDTVRSVLAVPLRIGERIFGAISAQSYKPHAFSQNDRVLLEMLAVQTASAMENAFMFKSLQRELNERKLAEERIQNQLNRLNALREIDQAITSTFDMRVSLEVLLSLVLKLLSVDAATVLLLNPAANTLQHVLGLGFQTRNSEDIPIKLDQSFAGKAVLERRMVRLPDLTGKTANKNFEDFIKAEGFVSYHCTPLIVKGHVLGVLEVFNRSIAERDEDWLDFLSTLAGQAAIAVDNAQLFSASRRELAERKRAQEELLKLNAELEARVASRTVDLSRVNTELVHALRVKDEFLANMSHELRTPLNAIIGLSESLEEQTVGPLNEKQGKYIGTVRESGQHLLELINDILDLAKIESGNGSLNRGYVDVHTVCHASLRMVNQMAQKRNQQVTIEADNRLTRIFADERRLKQMLVNLLSNAVKFTPENGRITLEARGNWEENTATFMVRDNGIGIKEEDLPRLFNPFVQLDSDLSRRNTGTGLGLSLVAQMAHMHGGSVGVESRPGVGSSFRFTLPLESAEDANIRTRVEAAGSPGAQSATGQKKHTILVVEDTEEVVMVIRDFLEFEGFRVEVAKNGIDGIIQAKKFRPDLILMDVQMPDMDGFEATRRLRQDAGFEHTPIIALTALAMSGDRERCIAAGMDEYISKPVNLRSMVELIRNFLPADDKTPVQ
jgi:PAS domain S-box-containing protein